ncbi:MAG: hypothetical protein WAX04_07960 [Oscillospiraceae bacterium]
MTKRTPFAIKLSIIFLSCLLIFTGMLCFLWSYLTEYEKTNPKNCINDYVELIKGGDFKSAMEFSGVKTSEFFSISEYEQYVKDRLGSFDNLNTNEVASTNPQERYFELRGDNDNSIKFILTKSDAKLKFNFAGYKLKQEDIKKNSYKINLPKGEIPTVNSIPLDESHIIDDKSIVLAYASLNDKTLIPTIVTYQVEGLQSEPKLSVKDLDKSKYICEFSADKSANITLVPSEANKTLYEKVAVETSMAYAKYISKDIEFDALTRYIYEDTSFYKSIKAYSNVWNVQHNTPVFENITAKNTVEYSKNHFATEVSFDYIITKGSIKRVYPTKYILSFIKVGNEFKLANLQSL